MIRQQPKSTMKSTTKTTTKMHVVSSSTSKTTTTTKSKSSTSTKLKGNGKKIIIKPFISPPKLPDNYYEITSQCILNGTLQYLQQRCSSNTSTTTNGSSTSSSSLTTKSSSSSSSTTTTGSNYSLQNAYNNTVYLVSHQYGEQLYYDLVQTFQQAAEHVLVVQQHEQQKDTTNEDSTNTSTSTPDIMYYIVEQYTIYTDYLLLCKHILNPLDRTWQWNDTINKAIPIVQPVVSTSTSTFNTSTTGNTNGKSSSNNNNTVVLQSIWQIGLTCFLRRLQLLKLDKILYQQWLTTFLNDWNPSTTTLLLSSSSSSTGSTPNTTSSGKQYNDRHVLQSVWYLWQDLNILGQLPIQYDMEYYWTKQSTKWMNLSNADSSPTNTTGSTTNSTSTSTSPIIIQQFIQFCYNKHIQCYTYRQWLPITWLWNILDVYLFQPQLIIVQSLSKSSKDNTTIMLKPPPSSSSSTATATATATTPMLLQDANLHPLLQEAIQSNNNSIVRNGNTSSSNITSSTSSTTTTATRWSTVQILWMLAGRVQGGQRVVATAIQQFARIEGLRCVYGNTTTNSNDTVIDLQQQHQQQQQSRNKSSTTTMPSNPNAVQDLLKLQDNVLSLIQSLPTTTLSQSGIGGLTVGPKSNFTPSGGVSSSSSFINNNNTTNSAASIISLKSVWEEVVNVDVQPSIAEQLAKFLDGILKSTKRIDQYQDHYRIKNNNSNTNKSNTSSASATATTVPTSNNTNTTIDDNNWLLRIVMGIFVPLGNKDIFEAFYKKDLAKRLLWNRVVSMDIEKQVCSLLKAECGSAYTSKMEGMFQDVDWSRETMLVYKESLTTTNSASTAVSTTTQDGTNNISISSSNHIVVPVQTDVQVLTTGYWPVYPQHPNLILPDSFIIPQEQFSNHYKTKYQGRRMTWQYSLGHCIIKANGYNRQYEFVVSLCQALTLLQFNNDNASGSTTTNTAIRSFTLPMLQTAIGIDDRDEMERILQSLSLGKEGTRILRKLDYDRDVPVVTVGTDTTGGGATTASVGTVKTLTIGSTTGSTSSNIIRKVRMNVDDCDKFIIDTNFKSKVTRIRITNIVVKETREEHDKTIETVNRDRLYLIDAVLVRIMKARKTIQHQQLIVQVLEQMKVPALPSDIKKRIESLIEREYMERDNTDRSRYNYLA